MKINKFDYQPIEAKAEKFRADHDLGRMLGINLELLLRKLNVVAVFKPLGVDKAFSGMALKQEGQCFMLVNSSVARGRQNFTIAHELYHLFVQRDFHVQFCYTGKFGQQSDPEERNADYFAASLIMPKYRILQAAGELEQGSSLSIKTIVELEQEFQCSRQALLIRLKELNLINAREQEDFGKNVILSARHLGFGTDLYQPTQTREAIGDYLPLASRLYDEERISETHYASLLHEFGLTPFEIDDTDSDSIDIS
jgi:Zn-dependent peptidase ImmA (M78 family)